MAPVNDWNTKIIAEFRANGGRVGGRFEGAPMILIHTVGARSGAARVNPLVYFPQDDGTMVIIASYAGNPRNPAWHHNIKADPEIDVEVGQCFGHRVVGGIADRADRGDRLAIGESFAVANRCVLHAAIGMVDEVGQVRAGVLAGPDTHVQCIQRKVGVEVRGQLPAHDQAGEHIQYERGVHPPGKSSYIDFGDPQLIRCGRDELAVDQVGTGVRAGAATGRGRRLDPGHAS